MPKIVLLINYWSKFDETSQKDKAYSEGVSRTRIRFLCPRLRFVIRSEVKIMSQQ